jgi:hypothetical protein
VTYVITFDGIITKFHQSYIKELGILTEAITHAQTIRLRKTLEIISLEKRRCIEENCKDYEIERSIK